MSASFNRQQEILIIGAGPVGLMFAACLAQYGIPCRLIDKNNAPSKYSKALAIFPRTLEAFETIGVVKPVLEAGKRLDKINIQAQQRQLGSLYFDKVNSPYPFIISLPQSETERILRQHLANFGVYVEQNVELIGLKQDEKGVTATLHHGDGKEETCQVGWLLGCDGSHSKVREILKIPFVGAPYKETFVLADIKLDGSLPNDQATVFYHFNGLLAMFPLPGGWFRVILNLPQDIAEDQPSLEQIQSLVDKRSSVKLLLSDPIWISKFYISRRKVKQFRAGRVFLAGDAAHIHSPAGGQGMNTGIQDAHNLAWKLALVVAGLSPLPVLDSYKIEREPVVKKVLLFTDLITRAATFRNPLAQSLRNVMLSAGTKINPIATRVANTLAEVNISYGDSPIVADAFPTLLENFYPGTIQAGDRAPDGQLYQLSGEPVRIFELLPYKHHVLLLFVDKTLTRDVYQNLLLRVKKIEENYSKIFTVHWILPRKELATNLDINNSVFIASESIFNQHYKESYLYLIRPDGYIGFCSSVSQWDKFKAYLQKVFC